MKNIPFPERNTRLRVILDLATGCYPAFVFGGKWNDSILPVFHFHEVTPESLEPYLQYLSENDYRTLAVDEFLDIVTSGQPKPPRSVLLCFDDAWTSIWTVAAPLLRRYQMRAVTFAIPGRVRSLPEKRDTIEDQKNLATYGDDSEMPFATWEELRHLDSEGVVAVESHTFSHEMIPVGGDLIGAWIPKEIQATPPLSRPVVREEGLVRALSSGDPLQPKFQMRSGMSDGKSIQPDSSWLALFREQGRAVLNESPTFMEKWIQSLPSPSYTEETEEERDERIEREIVLGKETLEEKLGRSQRLLCFPWAVAGTRALHHVSATGYAASFADRLWGKRYVWKKSGRFQLMRLKHKWILKLPRKK